MANYVRNYVYCDAALADATFLCDDSDYKWIISWAYGCTVIPLTKQRKLLIFNTHGMEYYEDDIRRYITENHDTVWLCSEESYCEEALFRWDGNEVTCRIRKFTLWLPDEIFHFEITDPEWRMIQNYSVSLSKVVVDNLMTNSHREYSFSKEASAKIYTFLQTIYQKYCKKQDPSYHSAEYTLADSSEMITKQMFYFWNSPISEWADYEIHCEPNFDSPKEAEENPIGNQLLRETQEFFSKLFLEEGISEDLFYQILTGEELDVYPQEFSISGETHKGKEVFEK